MRRLKKIGIILAIIVGLYLLLPLVIFDFSSYAAPYDEEYFNDQKVAIGPKPWWWVPFAARHLDIPGGFDYEESSWPFLVWRPLCVAFDRSHGYALPARWR